MGGWGGNSENSSQNNKYPVNGFPSLTRRRHFEAHGKDYRGSSIDDYEQLALTLRNRRVGADVREFISTTGLRFRYDSKNNDFLIYRENGEIVTLYKPEKGVNYWERQVEKYGTED
jgi:pyocin large subunit-like protein